MGVRNLHWYNRNEAGSYPVEDGATAVTDDGDVLPSDIICDLSLRFPRELGEAAFLSSVTVTENLVSVVILSTPSLPFPAQTQNESESESESEETEEPQYVALANVTLTKPIVRYRNYPLNPLSPGVGGWIVFGAGVVENVGFKGRFSTPEQSALCSKAAKNYRSLPVSSVGKLGSSSSLTGLVRLRGGNDIEIVKLDPDDYDEALEDLQDYLGAPLSVAVVRLKESSGAELLRKYVSGCQGRPETGNCAGNTPVETINGVGPDCDGQITIDLQGSVVASQIVSGGPCGVILDSPILVGDVCAEADRLPTSEGELPVPDALCDPLVPELEEE